MEYMNKTYTRLTLLEREEISRGIWAHENFTAIAQRINRSPSTITREVWSNVKYSWCYRAERAWKRSKAKGQTGRRPKKLDTNARLKEYVYEKLCLKWSPEEIVKRMRLEYSEDTTMRVSHEPIYRHLYCLARGKLREELMKNLRWQRKRRLSRQALHYRRQRIQDLISISERPKEAKGRIVPGHWEGDLLVGKQRDSALGTLVERTTRLTLLVPLKAKDAFAVREEFAKAFKKIPRQFKKTLTYDRGSEMSEHKLFTKDTKIAVYFADPHAPWQRGTNENTNGLIRQYFPKGTDFRKTPVAAIKEAERMLNSRPRKVLNFYTPSEKFYQLITGKNIAIEA